MKPSLFLGSSRKVMANSPSSVTCGDSFPPQGEAFLCLAFPLRGRCPEGADEVLVIPQVSVKNLFFRHGFFD